MKEILVWDIYVADSDEQAWAEAGPEITRFWQLATENVWRGDSVTMDDLPRFTERFAYFPGGLTVKRLDEWGISLIVCPDTVVKKARQVIATARPDILSACSAWRTEPRVGDEVDRTIRDACDARLSAEPLG